MASSPPDKGGNPLVDFSFLVHTVPDIPADAAIVGLCTVPPHRAGNEDHGWHVAAFAAWKALLSKVLSGNPEAWISAVGAEDVSRELAFGGKRVFHALETSVDVVRCPRELGRTFLSQISRLTEIKKRSTLVVIVCGPTSLGQDVLIDFDNAVPGQTPELVKLEAIRESAYQTRQLMLITPSMLAAGWWTVHPNLNQTINTPAASHIPPNTGKCPVSSDSLVKLFARRCAPLFTDQMTTAVFSRRSLFLDERYEQESPERITESLWSRNFLRPQKAAAETLRSELHKALLNNFAWFPSKEKFYFFPVVDSWTRNLQARVHLPLEQYNRPWDLLKDVRRLPSQHHEPEQDQEEHLISFEESTKLCHPVKNRTFSCVFGGSTPSHLAHMRTLASSAYPVGFKQALKHVQDVSVPPSDNHPTRLAFVYMYAAMSFADATVFYSKLERPQGQRCIHWDPSQANATTYAREVVWKAEFMREMRETGLFHLPKTGGGYLRSDRYFSHPVDYIWEAIKLKYGHLMTDKGAGVRVKPSTFLNELPEVFDVIRLMWQGVWQELLENGVVHKAAKDFHTTLGLESVAMPAAQIKFGGFPQRDNTALEVAPEAVPTFTTTLAQRFKEQVGAAFGATSPDEAAENTHTPVCKEETVKPKEEQPHIEPPMVAIPQQKRELRRHDSFTEKALAFLHGQEGFLWASNLAKTAATPQENR